MTTSLTDMKFSPALTMLLFCLISLLSPSCNSEESKLPPSKSVSQPNIIFILADDLGYGELGAYGQTKIETPNIDQLAREGMLFTQHYTGAPVCAPARCMLLTGLHGGHAYVRGNDEWKERGEVWDYRAMAQDSTLEGQRPLPDSTVTLAHYLQGQGYSTALIGKWGLGAPHTSSIPTKKGFDYFFGYNCQRQAHTYTPLHLYENESRVHLRNDTIAPRTKLPENADPANPGAYAVFTQPDYAPSLMTEHLLDFVKQQAQNPFFLYWASPIPHVPIQAPQPWVDYYQEKFGSEDPYLGEKGYFPHQSPRAGYAAMVSYLDENVGKLVSQLKKQGVYENTIIFFTSDNGPSFAGGTDSEWFNSAGPFAEEYGRGKGFVYEGGIRVPMIASWPGHIHAGSTSNLPSTHYDFWATVAELTRGPVVNTDGISYLPTLLGEKQDSTHDFLFWEYPEYGGQVAIRMGDWKIVRRNLKDDKQTATLELYNLAVDSIESNNLAEEYPEIIEQAATIFMREHTTAATQRWQMPVLEQGLLGQRNR